MGSRLFKKTYRSVCNRVAQEFFSIGNPSRSRSLVDSARSPGKDRARERKPFSEPKSSKAEHLFEVVCISDGFLYCFHGVNVVFHVERLSDESFPVRIG